MKRIVLLFSLIFLVLACSKPSECIESTGEMISKEFAFSNFDKIIVYQGIALVVTEGPEYSVNVIAGENIMDNIEVKVNPDTGFLSLKDNATCNFGRAYGSTTVYVTAPNITELHSKTEKTISSNGVLSYPNLRLFSLDLVDGAGTGDFNLQVNNNRTIIDNNNVARYYISGQTNELGVYFYDGNGRFEGQNLTAKYVGIYHRGSNDIIVKPIDKIEGDMVSTGNLILKNNPPINLVRELYTGRIIYN